MTTLSRVVMSNQTGVHDDLEKIVNKHRAASFNRPFHEFSRNFFPELDAIRKKDGRAIILDSGCGNGDSGFYLSKHHPDDLIIGIDKSFKRLSKRITGDAIFQKGNVVLAIGELNDIWRLAKEAKWQIKKHYLLYPNPWPKKAQFKRRWHGHPVFPEMVSLCDQIELRTNWLIYAEEFKRALEVLTSRDVILDTVIPEIFASPFEKKYYESGHELYRVLLS